MKFQQFALVDLQKCWSNGGDQFINFFGSKFIFFMVRAKCQKWIHCSYFSECIHRLGSCDGRHTLKFSKPLSLAHP